MAKRAAGPIVSFRVTLSILQHAGVTFDDAWTVAFPRPAPTHERAPLRSALDETRDAWARAYLGEPAERGEVAAVAALGWVVGGSIDDANGEQRVRAIKVG